MNAQEKELAGTVAEWKARFVEVKSLIDKAREIRAYSRKIGNQGWREKRIALRSAELYELLMAKGGELLVEAKERGLLSEEA